MTEICGSPKKKKSRPTCLINPVFLFFAFFLSFFLCVGIIEGRSLGGAQRRKAGGAAAFARVVRFSRDPCNDEGEIGEEAKAGR